jgi:hypothetical protein
MFPAPSEEKVFPSTEISPAGGKPSCGPGPGPPGPGPGPVVCSAIFFPNLMVYRNINTAYSSKFFYGLSPCKTYKPF